MPAWAMLSDLPSWLEADQPNWVIIVVGVATLILEVWMLIEAIILWPKVKGVMESVAPVGGRQPHAEAAGGSGA